MEISMGKRTFTHWTDIGERKYELGTKHAD